MEKVEHGKATMCSKSTVPRPTQSPRSPFTGGKVYTSLRRAFFLLSWCPFGVELNLTGDAVNGQLQCRLTVPTGGLKMAVTAEKNSLWAWRSPYSQAVVRQQESATEELSHLQWHRLWWPGSPHCAPDLGEGFQKGHLPPPISWLTRQQQFPACEQGENTQNYASKRVTYWNSYLSLVTPLWHRSCWYHPFPCYLLNRSPYLQSFLSSSQSSDVWLSCTCTNRTNSGCTFTSWQSSFPSLVSCAIQQGGKENSSGFKEHPRAPAKLYITQSPCTQKARKDRSHGSWMTCMFMC